MALTWGGVHISEELWRNIYSLTNVWPSVTGVVYGYSSISSYSYSTKLLVSSGPYVLVGCGSLSTLSSDDIDIKVTLDGSTVVEGLALAPTGSNYLFGLYFDDQPYDHAPALARSSIQIEARVSAGALGTQYVQWLYAGYSIT